MVVEKLDKVRRYESQCVVVEELDKVRLETVAEELDKVRRYDISEFMC